MGHIEQDNRPRFTLEEAQKASDTWVGRISHVVRNPEGDYSVMGHIVCEWCDYCTEQSEGVKVHDFREDPYRISGASDRD
jgi:hypothetical protein